MNWSWLDYCFGLCGKVPWSFHPDTLTHFQPTILPETRCNSILYWTTWASLGVPEDDQAPPSSGSWYLQSSAVPQGSLSCKVGWAPGLSLVKGKVKPPRPVGFWTKRQDTKTTSRKQLLFVVAQTWLNCLQPFMIFVYFPYMATYNFTGYFNTIGWDSKSARM